MQLPDTASNCVEPDSALLAYGAHVKVLPPLDPHAGHVGVVRRVWLAGADLLHCVRFATGAGRLLRPRATAIARVALVKPSTPN